MPSLNRTNASGAALLPPMAYAAGIMKDRRPVVSVTMQAYNCAGTVARAIGTLQRQSLSDFELIVVDDASTDDTNVVVASMAHDDPRIRLITLTENGGVGNAKRLAVEACRGAWITMLDSDDYYACDRLHDMVNAARELDAHMVLDNLQVFDHALERIVDRTRYGDKSRPQPLSMIALFKGDRATSLYPLGLSKPLFKREFLLRHNLNYVAQLRSGEDYALLSDVILAGGRAYVLSTAGYIYVHRASPSARASSPFSRSGRGHDDTLAVCSRILDRYGAGMNVTVRRAAEQRQHSFESWKRYLEFKDLCSVKQYGSAMRYLRKEPRLLRFKLFTVVNRLVTLARIWQSRRGTAQA
jgi:succinoglycan biosynthesis protein ExoO